MEPTTFTDRLEREEVIALGLPARRLPLAAGGGALVWGVLQLPLPVAARGLLAVLLGLVVTLLSWGRVGGAPLTAWAASAARFAARAGVTPWAEPPTWHGPTSACRAVD